MTAIFAAAVVLLGIIALVDIAVAYLTGSGELFLLQLLFNTVCDPSLTLEHLTGNLTPSTNETLTVIQGEVVNGSR